MTNKLPEDRKFDYELQAAIDRKNDEAALNEQIRRYDFVGVDLLKRLGLLEGVVPELNDNPGFDYDTIRSLDTVVRFLKSVPGSEAESSRVIIANVIEKLKQVLKNYSV